MEAPGRESMPYRAIPQAVLKVQVKRLVSQYGSDKQEALCTKDLLHVIAKYEAQHGVVLLTPNQKTAIQPYCLANPDLEMTCDDIVRLLKLVFPQQPIVPTSTPTIRHDQDEPCHNDMDVVQGEPLTAVQSPPSIPLETRSVPWKRRPSEQATPQDQGRPIWRPALESPKGPTSISEATVGTPQVDGQETQWECTVHNVGSVNDMEEVQEDLNQETIARFYRNSMDLTKRLKMSEQSLASMTRDNEDRIVQLQNSVDDMDQEVQRQRREILEYKNKEKSSLDQISKLEAHIAEIEQSKTDQKQVYLSIKRLFDEKCEETQKLQELLRQKELELQKTEAFLSSIHHEFKQSTEERNKLRALRKHLERELTSSQSIHSQLAEQRSENQRLKAIIDSLKQDLETWNALSDPTLPADKDTHQLIKTLEDELGTDFQLRATDNNKTECLDTRLSQEYDMEVDSKERLKSVEHEKDYYKLRANEAIEDLNKAKHELRLLKHALESENRSLVSELANLQTRFPDRRDDLDGIRSPPSDPCEVASITTMADAHKPLARHIVHSGDSPEADDTAIDMNISAVDDNWMQSKIRLRKPDNGKKTRGFQDLNKSTAIAVHVPEGQRPEHPPRVRPNDKAVTNTMNFALYTLLVYIFGIVTSTFLLETGQVGDWEQALVAAASDQGGTRSNVLDILIYWIEKLLFEGNNIPLS